MMKKTVFVVLAVVGLAASATAEPNVRMPAPASATYVRGTRAMDDAACGKCHQRIAEEHAGSLHHASFSDASFQKGYTKEPSAFCRSCHAPEAKPDETPDAFASENGVACITCHKPDASGAILSGEGKGSARSAPPHAVARVADFGTRACASCHEFAFPGGEKNGTKSLMQKTMTEHAESSSKDRSCGSCHMPNGGHRFLASRSPAMLERALDVKVEREEGEAVFTLGAREVGHAFPTGDLLRRLVVRLKADGSVVEQPLARNFGSTHAVRYEVSDLRLRARKTLSLPLPRGTRASWEVLYQRVTAVDQAPPFSATVEAELVLARGSL